MSVIRNAGSIPLDQQSIAPTPNMASSLMGYFQPMVFNSVAKSVEGFQLEEVGNPIYFRGTWQPLTERQLMLKPEGQRAWTWFLLHSDTALVLNVDDVVIWNGKQTRVMGRKDFSLYGYVEYSLVQDWTGSGPG